MGHGLTVHKAHIVGCGDHVRQLQIMMRLKTRPPFPACLSDFQLEAGSLKTPPCPAEAVAAGVENPVRRQPVDDVIMARKQNGLPAGTPPCSGEGGSADSGNLAVHNARKLVHNDTGRRFADNASKRSPELLAGAQDVIGPQPCGNVSKPHGGKGRGDGPPVSALGVRRYGVDYGGVLRPAFLAAQGVFAPYPRSQTGLAGAGRPHHKPDLPRHGRGIVNGQVGFQLKADAFHVKETLHACGAVGLKGRGRMTNENLHTRTTLHLYPSAFRRS